MKQMSKEQVTGNKDSVFKRGYFPLLLAICSLLFVNCELFSGPEVDVFQQISNEVDWANATKLSVNLEYPGDWGSSNPVRGSLTPAKDIRLGYSFDLEFTPDPAYSFQGWRAYSTQTLSALGGDWRLDITLLDTVAQLAGVEITNPNPLARGGKANFKINTPVPVTLVPWCKTEPYVTRTDPRTETRDSVTMRVYHPSTAIVVYFNAALDPDMVWSFGAGMVNIEARLISSIATDGPFTAHNEWFDRIEYDSRGGQHTVTIYPNTAIGTGPEPDYQIKVTVGPSIRNTQGEFMNPSEPEIIYYKVSNLVGVDAGIDTWEAKYNTAGTITVTWDIGGANALDAIANVWYQVNRGANQPFTTFSKSGTRFTGTISGVGRLDDNGVREGRAVSNIQEYQIFMALEAGGYPVDNVNFKIWNFPDPANTSGGGMIVNNSNPAIEVIGPSGAYNSSARTIGLSSIASNSLSSQYVLASSFTVSGHTPINNFTGKFYGNGHTVTISSMNAAADMGLFGMVDNALIRDLTVQYNATAINPSGAAQFGGIAGTAQGKALFENVIIKGKAAFTVSGNTNAYVGGIVGLLGQSNTSTPRSEAKINNAYSELDLTVETVATRTTAVGAIYVGGIAGSVGRPDTGDPVKVIKAKVVGDITVGSLRAVNAGSSPNSATSGLYVGGIAGFLRGHSGGNAALESSDYTQGTITATSGLGCCLVGGAVGRTFDNVTIEDCFARQGAFNIEKTGNNNTDYYIGGFIGDSTGVSLTIKKCYSIGPVTAMAGGSFTGDIIAGGFIGRFPGEISYCYAQGDVSVFGYGFVYTGGFAGYLTSGSKAEYCYATGNVSAICRVPSTPPAYADLYAGGFAGSSNTISNCYATGNVFADTASVSGNNAVIVGGLVGAGTTVDRCFSTGSVTAQRSTSGDIYAAGVTSGGTVTNSAALGASIIATGGTGRSVGRICTVSSSSNSNNHANNGMALWQNSVYGAPSGAAVFQSTGSSAKDGIDAHDGDFRTSAFWQNTLNFSSSYWSFTTTGSRRHPILKGVNGVGLLGGQ